MDSTASEEAKIKQLSIRALRDAEPGFDEFTARINACCEAFEDGDDEAGNEHLAQLVKPLSEFATFCHTVLTNCHPWLEPATVDRFTTANAKLEEALHTIVGEAEDENPSGIADACRVELTDALAEYQTLFPGISAELTG